mgnify:CR=1 FL=1
MDYSYGQGSRVFLTGKVSRNQARTTGLFGLYNPSSYSGNRFDSKAFILGWTHQFVQSAERALALDVKVARTIDSFIGGALDPAWDVDNRDTFLGFTFSGMEFLVDEDDFPVNDQLVSNYLRNEGRRTPFDLSRTDLRGRSEFRMNPYAITRGTVATFNTEFLFDGIEPEGGATFPWKGDSAAARRRRRDGLRLIESEPDSS